MHDVKKQPRPPKGESLEMRTLPTKILLVELLGAWIASSLFGFAWARFEPSVLPDVPGPLVRRARTVSYSGGTIRT